MATKTETINKNQILVWAERFPRRKVTVSIGDEFEAKHTVRMRGERVKYKVAGFMYDGEGTVVRISMAAPDGTVRSNAIDSWWHNYGAPMLEPMEESSTKTSEPEVANSVHLQVYRNIDAKLGRIQEALETLAVVQARLEANVAAILKDLNITASDNGAKVLPFRQANDE